MVRMSGNRLWSWSALVMALVVAVMSSPGAGVVQARGLVRLEIFSSWTWGSEAEGLKALVQAYEQRHAGVEVVNVATAGSATTNDMAILTARMLGGNPPDSFQAHGGEELASTWVTSGYVEPLTPLYEREGWAAVLPKSLLNIVTYKGDQYSVPVSVHRGNVLWYNKKILDENKLAPPTSWDEFFKVASALRAKGIAPLALGDKNKWEAAHLFEDVLLGALGPIGYRGLWSGKTSWTGDSARRALQTYARVLDYANPDHATGTWDSAAQMLIDGKAAMTVMGDWASGYFNSHGWAPGVDYGYVPAFGSAGAFIVISAAFSLPKRAPHREQALNWLRVAGSKEGQEALNPLKGSFCARIDCDPTKFDGYWQSAGKDYVKNVLVPSEVHGSAAPPPFTVAFNDIVSQFVSNRDVVAAQSELQNACSDNKMCP